MPTNPLESHLAIPYDDAMCGDVEFVTSHLKGTQVVLFTEQE